MHRVVVAFQQTLPTGVNRINGEKKATPGVGVNVAVIDTGIDLTHPDLQANIVGGKNCSTGRSFNDGNGHGTHVAGIVAAGNSAADLSGFVPAAYNEVIAVTALADSDGASCGVGALTSYGADDTFASFSNFATGADLNHVIAGPGVSILSTYKGGSYATLSGTSMASPHVAGAAALYLATHPGYSPAAVLQALLALGEPPNVNFSAECAGGAASHTDVSGTHPEPVVRADAL